jgi:type II secretory pathway component GspD/PulD (secretin)
MTLNNREARIESVRIVRVPTPSTTSIVAAPGAIGAAEAAFQEFSTGIILSVTPQVSADGFVFLAIETESSQLAISSIDSSITNIPDELSRTANSSVLIKSGETFVLGGIVRDEFSTLETGVPYLRDVPVLGWLFKGRSVDEGKEELLVFITPTIAASPQLAGLPTAQQLWENRPRTMSEQP